MSYEVLARKWRPSNFSEMVGQEHVLRALTNALNSGRLHHAHLFTGTRGVGKTTISRIFAKCLNCEQGVTAKPCGTCSACREISEGRFIDLVEVDAASKTKVDDTRELLDNVQYTPTSGRYKIYLIDEVHMLSKHSFNALLKTLEEPPPHVKFLFATTDYDKIPPTILSRCLQFNLKRIPVDAIAGHLGKVLESETIEFDKPALDSLATAADGSIRDALSLMDQAIAFGNGSVNEADVNTMLGSIPKHELYQLLQKLAGGDANAVLDCVDKLDEMAPDYDNILAELISLFHHLAVINEVPESVESRFFDQSEQLSELVKQFSVEDIQLFYDIAIRARRDMPYVQSKKHGLEMALMRMLSFTLGSGPESDRDSDRGSDKGLDKTTAPRKNHTPVTPPAKTKQTNSQARSPAPEYSEQAATPILQLKQSVVSDINKVQEPQAKIARQPEDQTRLDPGAGLTEQINEVTHVKVDHIIYDWMQTIEDMGLGGMAKAFAIHCELKSSTPGQVHLVFSEKHEILHNADVERIIREALEKHQGVKIKLIIEKTAEVTQSPALQTRKDSEARQNKAAQDIASDPLIETLSQTFGAEIIKGTIKAE